MWIIHVDLRNQPIVRFERIASCRFIPFTAPLQLCYSSLQLYEALAPCSSIVFFQLPLLLHSRLSTFRARSAPFYAPAPLTCCGLADYHPTVHSHVSCRWLGDRSFPVVGPRIWNMLPASLRSVDDCVNVNVN